MTLWAGRALSNKRSVSGRFRFVERTTFHCVFYKTTVWTILVRFRLYLRGYPGYGLKICYRARSKVVFGNGTLNSKMIVGAIIMVDFVMEGHIYCGESG